MQRGHLSHPHVTSHITPHHVCSYLGACSSVLVDDNLAGVKPKGCFAKAKHANSVKGLVIGFGGLAWVYKMALLEVVEIFLQSYSVCMVAWAARVYEPNSLVA